MPAPFSSITNYCESKRTVEAHELLAGYREFSRNLLECLELGRKTLIELGMHPHQAYRAQQHFRRLDMQLLRVGGRITEEAECFTC